MLDSEAQAGIAEVSAHRFSECPLSQWAHRLCVNDPVSGLMSGLRPHPFPGGYGADNASFGGEAGGGGGEYHGQSLVFWLSLGNLGQLCLGLGPPESNAHHRMMGAGDLASSGALLSWRATSLKDPVTATRSEGTHVWAVLCTEALG